MSSQLLAHGCTPASPPPAVASTARTYGTRTVPWYVPCWPAARSAAPSPTWTTGPRPRAAKGRPARGEAVVGLGLEEGVDEVGGVRDGRARPAQLERAADVRCDPLVGDDLVLLLPEPEVPGRRAGHEGVHEHTERRRFCQQLFVVWTVKVKL